jgi:peptide/nickel transport system permease protein
VGLGAALIATISGILVGVSSAYFGGPFDFFLQRIVDTLQAFPPLVLLLLFGQVVANPTLEWNTISLGILGVASSSRVVRSAVLSAREEVYVMAARTIGATDLRVMGRHIFPNITAPIIVTFTGSIGIYILVEATLAFLGLGDPTRISWGKMIEEGRRNGVSDPWMAFAVGMALTITVLGFNLAGDALRDVLDPRLRGRGGRAGF